ncbi:hypothetical protein ACS0TY_024351 [Phlomoides rotata]
MDMDNINQEYVVGEEEAVSCKIERPFLWGSTHHNEGNEREIHYKIRSFYSAH